MRAEGGWVCVAQVLAVEDESAGAVTLVRAPHSMDYSPTRWPQSPRIAMRCAPIASNGPDHLGLRCDALPEHQMALITSDCDAPP